METAPLRVRTVDAVELQLEQAGAGSRAYAFLIDWHIRLLAAAVWGFGALILIGAFGGGTTSTTLGAGLPAALIYFLYHPVLEVVMSGRTPGKRWVALRIVNQEGQVPGVGALLIRNLFRLIDGVPGVYALGLTVMLCSKEQLRIGDMAAGTRVIYDGGGSSLAEAASLQRQDAAEVVQLLREWLQRWNELDQPQRDSIARHLLRKLGPDEHAAASHALQDAPLRDYVQKLMHAH